MILLQNTTKRFSIKEEMNYLIILVLFHDVNSILAIELLNQDLNKSQRFKNIATNLCFEVIIISRLEHKINNTKMF
jgi:hypothetical protein